MDRFFGISNHGTEEKFKQECVTELFRSSWEDLSVQMICPPSSVKTANAITAHG